MMFPEIRSPDFSPFEVVYNLTEIKHQELIKSGKNLENYYLPADYMMTYSQYEKMFQGIEMDETSFILRKIK